MDNVTAIRWRDKVKWHRIPVHMHEIVANYVERGYDPGDFLRCIITNDLRGAVAHADDINRHLLYDYVIFFHAFAPSMCWGSREAMDNWIETHRQERNNGIGEALDG